MPVTARFHTSSPRASAREPTDAARPIRGAYVPLHPPAEVQRTVEGQVDQPLSYALVEARRLGSYPVIVMPAETAELLAHQALDHADVLHRLFGMLGLRHFGRLAATCRAWRDAVDSRCSEWGMLYPKARLGKGYGKGRGELDLPNHVTMLPSGRLLVTDSCNERLVEMSQDGVVGKVVGKPGAKPHQLSSPSAAVCGGVPGSEFVYAASLLESLIDGAVSQQARWAGAGRWGGRNTVPAGRASENCTRARMPPTRPNIGRNHAAEACELRGVVPTLRSESS